MDKLISIERPDDLAPFMESPCMQGVDRQQFTRHQADESCLMVNANGQAIGRCSLWWQQVPVYKNEQLGVIGHYAVENEAVAARLLQHATERLQRQGCTLAVGPMDGNTWRSYRFVTEDTGEPPFFLEPTNPAEWPQHWQHAGFAPMAYYSSALNTDLSQQDPRLGRAWERLQQQGIHLRPLDLDAFEAELNRIYDVSVESFTGNFLYTPIDREEFIEQYRQVKPYVRPELTLIAEKDGQTVGFLFALPDLMQAQRGETVDTVIIKTVAVLPGRASAGLGSVLVGKVQDLAHAAGYTRAIHALMQDSNKSRNISGHYAKTMRRYTLFAKVLNQ